MDFTTRKWKSPVLGFKKQYNIGILNKKIYICYKMMIFFVIKTVSAYSIAMGLNTQCKIAQWFWYDNVNNEWTT